MTASRRVALVLLLAGCSSPGTRLDRLPDDAPARGYVVLPRPLSLPQSRLTSDCGPESICAVLGYWGKATTVEQLSQGMRDPGVVGLPPNLLPPLARRHGLQGKVVEGSVGRIKRAVDRGVPPIIMVQWGGSNFHYFVVSGYSDREQVVVCEEYGDAKRLLGYAEIDPLWTPAGRFMIELEKATADADFRAAVDREAAWLYDEAAALYRRALEADPDHLEARIGLGTCLLLLKKPEEALKEYRRAQAAAPSDPKVCNNLAAALLELRRETPEAERLAGTAVDHYRKALKDLRADVEKETKPEVRGRRQRELAEAELDLAGALGTLGQACAAHGRHREAVAAWRASCDLLPLTEFRLRAKRLHDAGLSLRALSMPAEGRASLEKALAEARDPDQRAAIEADLRK